MPHPSGLSYEDQLKQQIRVAKKKKDAERLAYYQEILDDGNTCACADFDYYKGSWAYDQWIKKESTKAQILKAQAILGD